MHQSWIKYALAPLQNASGGSHVRTYILNGTIKTFPQQTFPNFCKSQTRFVTDRCLEYHSTPHKCLVALTAHTLVVLLVTAKSCKCKGWSFA